MTRAALFLSCCLCLLIGCAEPDYACDDPAGCILVGDGEPIQIALLLASSGEAIALGNDARGGVEIALRDREGEVLGHPVQLLSYDTGCNRTDAISAAETVVQNEQIVGVIGTSCGATAVAASPILMSADLMLLSPSNTGYPIPQSHYIRTAPPFIWQADVVAQFVVEVLDGQTAAILTDNTTYNLTLSHYFANGFRERGGEILFQTELDPLQSDLSRLQASSGLSKPDVVFMALFEPEAGLVANLFASNEQLGDVVLIGGDSLFAPTFPVSSGDAVRGMYVVGTAVTNSDYNQLLLTWERIYGTLPPSTYHAYAYDTTNMLFSAIEQVAEPVGSGDLLIGRQRLQEAILAQSYDGLTGQLQCLPSGDCASRDTIGIYQVGGNEVDGVSWPPPLVWTPQR